MGGVIWNLFLAVVPIVLAYLLCGIARQPKKSYVDKAAIAILGLVWLAFLPNTCYLLTEWRHFLQSLDAHNLYLKADISRDLMIRLMLYTSFYFCYSAAGMIAYVLALRPVARLAIRNGGNKWLLGLVLFPLLSLGVYLGLVLRFNSWDLLQQPNRILTSLQVIASRPLLTTFLLIFAAFLWLSYLVLDIWIDGLLLRWKTVTTEKAR